MHAARPTVAPERRAELVPERRVKAGRRGDQGRIRRRGVTPPVHAHRAVRHAQLGQADALDGECGAVRLRAAAPGLAAEQQQLFVELQLFEQALHATFDVGGRGSEMRMAAEHGPRI